jgi:hypothetical protein
MCQLAWDVPTGERAMSVIGRQGFVDFSHHWGIFRTSLSRVPRQRELREHFAAMQQVQTVRSFLA